MALQFLSGKVVRMMRYTRLHLLIHSFNATESKLISPPDPKPRLTYRKFGILSTAAAAAAAASVSTTTIVKTSMRRSRKTRTRVKRRRTKMSDLNVDVLQVVMNFVAQSTKGLQSLANAISACKIFKESAESKQVLHYVNVAYKDVSVCPNSLWNTRGILHKCARSGNRSALNTILQYTKKRIEFSKAKMEYIELVRQRLVEAFAAVEVVNTRARKREAQFAFEFYEEMKNDLLQDHQEISDQLETFESLQLS